MAEYKTELLCPVCGEVMDTLSHPTPELSGMGEAMLGQDARRDHAAASPDCEYAPGWEKGWNRNPLGKVESHAS